MYKRIVVPLDGSDIAEMALPEAKRMARNTGASLHLVRVVDPSQLPWYGAYADAMGSAAVHGALSDEERISDSYLTEVAKRITDIGIEVDTEIRRGHAAKELVAAAEPGDIIVIASHGRGGISRWLLGSVAEQLVRYAAVPVLLVKATKVVPADATGTEAEPVAAGAEPVSSPNGSPVP